MDPGEQASGPSNKKHVLCKYFMHGACSRGEVCAFSHDLAHVAPNTVCTHWLRGSCKFGDNCRYDHIRPDWAPRNDKSELTGYKAPTGVQKPITDTLEDLLPISRLRLSGQGNGLAEKPVFSEPLIEAKELEGSLPVDLPVDPFGSDEGTTSCILPIEQPHEGLGQHIDRSLHILEDETNSRHNLHTSHDVNAWSLQDEADYDEYWNEEHDGLACQGGASFCHEYFSTGTCSRFNCRLVHGHLCEICENYALHPSDLEAVEQHKVECRSRHEKLQARSRSSNVECSICLEKVLDKAGDRKFGLLDCEHPFCLSCIRSWRSQTGGADVDSAVRTCPVCRVTTYFITPSVTWPQTPDEKQQIIDGYKSKLASIDCRNFNFGEGTCPFGTCCFYRHAYKDGTLEDRAPRVVAADEGEVKYISKVLLSDFLEIKQGRVRGRR